VKRIVKILVAGLVAVPIVIFSVAGLAGAAGERAAVEMNAAGQKIGDYRVGGEKPDLIEGQTDSGKPGYIYLKDIMWDAPKTPADAVRLMKERVNEQGEIVVPVYEADGVTVIGYFTAATVEQGE